MFGEKTLNLTTLCLRPPKITSKQIQTKFSAAYYKNSRLYFKLTYAPCFIYECWLATKIAEQSLMVPQHNFNY